MEQAHSSTHSEIENGQVISIDRHVRWQVRQRLQELNVSCECLADGSLRVLANTPVALVQIRSVLQHYSMPRSALIEQFENCWRLSN